MLSRRMKSIPYTTARENLASTINLCEDQTPAVITRIRDQAVVMLSLAEFESLDAAFHPATAAELHPAGSLRREDARSRRSPLPQHHSCYRQTPLPRRQNRLRPTPAQRRPESARRSRYPRDKTRDPLLQQTAAAGIYFEDFPELASFTCPEWSHLSAVEFTRRLVPHLRNALQISPAASGQ